MEIVVQPIFQWYLQRIEEGLEREATARLERKAKRMIRRTAREIRNRNRFDVLRFIYSANGPVSRQEAVSASGLSFATVAGLVSELLEVGVLVEVGREDSGGGRPRGQLAVNAQRGVLVGVDVAETNIHIELFDLALTVLQTLELPLSDGENAPGDIVDGITAGLGSVLEAAGMERGQVLGVGVSVPGLVEREGGVSVFSPYWAWREVPLRSLLSERLELPLYLDNPLKASTVAEMWFGAGRGVDDLVVVTLRTGVGAGVAVDGALYRGATNSAGEWGHTCLVVDGRLCRCGNRGCVEAYVGAPGIMQTLAELVPDSPLLHGDGQAAIIDAVARAAADGDPVAAKVVAETGRYLGIAVANLINLFNPEVLVLGDWVATTLGEPLLHETHDVAARHALSQPFRAVTLQLCALRRNTVSLGAATFALEGFLNDQEIFRPVASRLGARQAARA